MKQSTLEKPYRIIDIVFTRSKTASWTFYALGILIAALIHSLLVLAPFLESQKKLEEWVAAMDRKVHNELSRTVVVAMPETVKPPPVHKDPPKPKPISAPRTPTSKSPAKAASIIAKEADPHAPVDLSDLTFVTGTAESYAGGVTAARGTSDKAVEAVDQSRAVSLNENQWFCSWPSEAESQSINEQSVVLKVVVRTDGSVDSANILSDPGQGFAAAAIACALRTPFSPALNAEGKPVQAMSPPIRVRFSR